MDKRILILAGHYGSGKTNIAVNLAMNLRREGRRVAIADLDIVNPYFRTKDSLAELEEMGIPLISSEYANTNVDLPALPAAMYSVVDDRNSSFVLDIGGDDRGALALGRLAPRILEENSYEMILVANFCRPLTRNPDSLVEVMREMEAACGIPFTAVAHNSNLGEATTPSDVLSAVAKAEEFSRLVGLPIVFHSVRADLYPALKDEIPNLFPLNLQKKYY
ncbi:MAG: P-loop NTPase [Clostridia bacterium]|nr:P-loop NTPase [Clostridia bacterium]